MRKKLTKKVLQILALCLAICIMWSQQSVSTIASEIVVQATDEVTGTLGDNGGFKWSYEKSTGTLTITGSDTGRNKGQIKDSLVGDTILNVIFKDCKFIGSLNSSLSGINPVTVEFENYDT